MATRQQDPDMEDGAAGSASKIAHARPIGQPNSVPQIAERLFAAYSVAGGKLSLAGCTLEDRPFLRLVFHTEGAVSAPQSEWSLYFDAAARRISDELAMALGLAESEPWEPPPLRASRPQWDTLFPHALSAAKAENAERGRSGVLASRTVVWCKQLSGKLRFTGGETPVELPFGGWARNFSPPPYVCPHSGASSFRLAVTSDGRMVAAEQLAVCDRTAQRALRGELATCSITGKMVLAEFTAVCPITGLPVLGELFGQCALCQQRVGPAGLASGTCRACRGLSAVTEADPRMARLLGEYPRLERWRRWRLAETHSVYIALGAGVWKRLVLVVDKASLEPLHVAEGHRLSRTWTAVAPADRQSILRHEAE